MRRIIPLAIVLAIAAAFSGNARGQDQTAFGRIEGLVKDPSGTILPGVRVTLTGSNAAARESITGADGRFVFEGVLPGTAYGIRGELRGFTTDRETSITVIGGQTRTFELELAVGCVNECVCVTGVQISHVNELLAADAVMHVRVEDVGEDEHDGCGPPREAVVLDGARFGGSGERIGKTLLLKYAQKFQRGREYLMVVNVHGVKHPRVYATFTMEVVRGRVRGEDAADLGIRSGMPIGEALTHLRQVRESSGPASSPPAR